MPNTTFDIQLLNNVGDEDFIIETKTILVPD